MKHEAAPLSFRSSAQDQPRVFFSGWAGGFTTYAYGLFISYIIFVTLFGPVYSLQNLFTLASEITVYPLSLAQLLLQLYIISFFAIPMGMAFRILWEKRNNTTVRYYTTALIGVAALLGLRVALDPDALGEIVSLALFSLALVWLLWRGSHSWDEGRHATFTFPRAIAVLYCTFFAILFVALVPQPLSSYSFNDLIFTFIPYYLLPIQGTSLLLAFVAAPALWLIADQRKPRTIWFILAGIGILSVVSLSRDIFAGTLLIGLTALLYYRYDKETMESYGDYTRLSYVTNPNPNSDPTSTLGKEPLQVISASLNKLAQEAEFLREVRTGEVLRVKRHEPYILQMERKVIIDSYEKTIGINHYLISSRTGHGKTTLVKNLVRYYQNYGFIIMDRHDEYEGQILQLDKEFDPEKFESLLSQLPTSSLSQAPNILRESQIFNIEQQFETLVKNGIHPKAVEEIYTRLQRQERIILRPGRFTDFIYTRICHGLISEVFQLAKKRKKETDERLGFVIINEEAQNSFNVDEYGEERERNHPLLRVVHEGRKYGIAIINITSNPESIPRTVKDNSILILGSIGTPAIKRLVGEKLGMIYVRYIYELPVGEFFLDLVDSEGNYIVFPDHFGVREFIDAIKT